MSEPRKCVAVLAGACVGAALSVGTCRAAPASAEAPIDFSRITSPIIHKGNATCAYRDPAAHYHDGVFRVFHTLHRRDDDGHYYVYTAMTGSRDLVRWTKPRVLTPKDRKLNFSSPGNIVRHDGKWVICLQTYPTPNDETFGTQDARIWTMASDDLEHWSQPEMLRVKGPDVAVKDMGRMIDPYLLRDRDKPSRWWCFYKQRGVSMSYSDDGMKTWTYHGRTSCGENVCVLAEKNRYVIFHSPGNGIGVKASRDLKRFEDVALLTLGQKDWPWAQGRLTAGQVLDLRREPRVGKALLFFHGSSKAGLAQHRAHGHGTLALAWSDDLKTWHWPGKPRLREGAAQGNSAKAILDATGVKGGLVVHLGCGDGRLTAALRANDSYIVHGLDTAPANVAAARSHVRGAGLSGSVWVDRFDGNRLPYAENTVNLLAAEGLGEVSMDEVRRVLAPGGTAYVKTASKWVKTVKPWPEDIDEWTHFLHDATGNAVAHDRVVAAPKGLQWIGGPLWSRSHEYDSSLCAMVSARGRLFYIFDEGPTGIVDKRIPDKWTLIARDAFNGVVLWKRRIPDWGWKAWKRSEMEQADWRRMRSQRHRLPLAAPRRLVAAGDRIYVTLGYRAPVTALDAATGRTRMTCAGTEGTDEIVHDAGLLVLVIRTAAEGPQLPAGKGGRGRREASGIVLAALEADTGRLLWRTAPGAVVPLTLAVSGGHVFFHDRDAAVCLDATSGRQRWRTPTGGAGGSIWSTDTSLIVYKDVVLCANRRRLAAMSGSDGKVLWKLPGARGYGAANPPDLFVADGLVWYGRGRPEVESITGYDPRTGKGMRTVRLGGVITRGHHARCYRSKATDNYLLLPKRAVEFIDIRGAKEPHHSRHNWVRGACRYGVLPCNGLLYSTPHPCFCYAGVKLGGFLALSPRQAAPAEDRHPRLIRGPAYDAVPAAKDALEAGADDWTMYRHDPKRSGSTPSVVDPRVRPVWRARLGGKLTQPVVVGRRLFAARVHAGQVCCLDARTGQSLWEYAAGGRIDSAPTYYKGRLIFGSADGRVYCLRASDGALAWRFRAAPAERRVVAFGQVESAWPVHGSVLVMGDASTRPPRDTAYFAAGRSSFLDGGMVLYGLDPLTGRKRYETQLDGPHPDTKMLDENAYAMEGAKSDILVTDGRLIYLFHNSFDGRLKKQPTPVKGRPGVRNLGVRDFGRHLFSNAGFLDDSGFNRSYWMYGDRWPAFNFAHQSPHAGQLVVFDDACTYAAKCFVRRNMLSPQFFPATDGYYLVADDHATRPVLVDGNHKPDYMRWLPQAGKPQVCWNLGVGFARSKPAKWMKVLPVRIRAMVRTGSALFVAGPPDVCEGGDPTAALEGRAGAVLVAFGPDDGRKLYELKLDSPPVLDGMAAAGGRLYVSDRNGRVLCLGKAK